MTNAELLDLLREARDVVDMSLPVYSNSKLVSRIDAALATHDTPHKVAWRNLDYKAIYVADCDGADLEVQLGAERWHWETSRYGDCATLEEAQAAAVKAARSLK